ncbi:MAG: winged helix-turn-helix domain-containing protein [Chloroflexi bacterium]|nr:winged helix-turn-helix domain-containing protein [Chloroflexota bacterium]
MSQRLGIYLAGESVPDAAIVRGLQQADCEVIETRTVSETIDRVRAASADVSETAPILILVAEVQAGAIPLLILLHDIFPDLPPTLLYDRKGDDIHAVIKALQLGVREYLLGGDPDINRELSARLLAERAGAERQSVPEVKVAEPVQAYESGVTPAGPPVGLGSQFQWDSIGHVLHLGDSYVRLSPIEGRIFDLLLTNHNRTVPMEELVRHVLTNPNVDVEAGVKQLRPHIVRLRRKLERYPILSNRILNMRGAGYMFI